ncbi:hypothetical protein [uncultured Hyphomicrobium sp.]|uniref:hypothetical protein n=1 Tax=uncultured Hyphomicrobium sp. TaxID=194373 RepID=UPI0025FBC4F1|nr:hypothetical protein [uncultured Hyphomicrobium sp.]
MTSTTAQRLMVFALAPLVLMGALRPAAQAEPGFSSGDVRLELASLKAEARSLAVHIDGP